MPFNNLSKKHQTRITWLGCPHSRPLSVREYLDCIEFLRPLFERIDFQNLISGFYINSAEENAGEKRLSFRVTYFTNSPLKIRKIIKNFEKKHSDKIKIYSFNLSFRRELFKSLIFFLNPKECDDDMWRFNKFLNTYTQIGLDLLKNFGELCSRRLVAEYRLDYHPLTRQQRATPKEFFEPIFDKHSQFFRELRENYSANQLWEDFTKADRKGVRLHFLVNMFLALDLNPYGGVISEQTKRNFLNEIELDLPENWRQDCDF